MAPPVSQPVSMLALSSSMARHAATRHALISQNIANADTPGYKAKDIADFSAVLKAQAMGQGEASLDPMAVIERPTVGSPNGNSVSLEEELMRGAAAKQDHQLAISMYRSTLGLMKTAVGKNL
ncbi:flagellar biosynthesis protein FlgB [Algimonas ampicilliniresistens]|uniref:Flagellar biosynthesis protein FlgB n=1 Tax=Algimonas ampicilliniresistens TaxID=1298735 RepID=A0ABQ5VBJ9_9PROT|nr:flagellar basal body protein [Algimonas ampicilliniresistens]GLQ24362.1 flagellar biosynthesis protein FlgB [Algimonas ampicilliniresistens]